MAERQCLCASAQGQSRLRSGDKVIVENQGAHQDQHNAAAHFGGRHESEDLYLIGPLPIPMPTQSTRKESR